MSLQPYEHYAEVGSASAGQRWNARMKFFVIGFVVAGLLVGLAVGGGLSYPLGGGVVGGLLGYGVFRLVLYRSAASSADDAYRIDWCSERAMKYVGDDFFPPDAPHAHSGDKQRATDAYQGTWNGLETLFYNFTYTEKGDGDDPDTDYDFKIMRLTGRELPIARLNFKRRGMLNRFDWADKLQGAMTKERPVSLESAEFNSAYDLTIDDAADDIWIRRIFDPATIAAVLAGQIIIPDLAYYDWAWWTVEKGHFKTRELEQWTTHQKAVADAVAVLSRVQSL